MDSRAASWPLRQRWPSGRVAGHAGRVSNGSRTTIAARKSASARRPARRDSCAWPRHPWSGSAQRRTSASQKSLPPRSRRPRSFVDRHAEAFGLDQAVRIWRCAGRKRMRQGGTRLTYAKSTILAGVRRDPQGRLRRQRRKTVMNGAIIPDIASPCTPYLQRAGGGGDGRQPPQAQGHVGAARVACSFTVKDSQKPCPAQNHLAYEVVVTNEAGYANSCMSTHTPASSSKPSRARRTRSIAALMME